MVRTPKACPREEKQEMIAGRGRKRKGGREKIRKKKGIEGRREENQRQGKGRRNGRKERKGLKMKGDT